MKIGVFDSGIGGLSVANAVQAAFPEHEVVFRNDSEHVPYGSRQPSELLGFVVPILQAMVDEGCSALVIACNTVSTTLISDLRRNFDVPIIALEPMVKPAAELTKSKIIAICATPTTLKSDRYQWLKSEYAKDVTVLEPDCSDWAAMIEANHVTEQTIAGRINEVLDAGADVIVLGCTHYHWIENVIKAYAGGKATVIQPEPAIVRELKRVLGRLG